MSDRVLSLITGAGVAGAAMYLLDPEQGRRRRALTRDKITKFSRMTRRMFGATGIATRDLGNRSSGVITEFRSRFWEKKVDDEVLEGRVRSKLGFLVRHPSAITTRISDGRVILGGTARSDEVDQLLNGVRAVRGVADVENQLAVQDDTTRVPGLRSDKPKPSGEVWDIMQRRWAPATRLLIGTAGAVSLGLLAYSLSDGSTPDNGHKRWRNKQSARGEARVG